MSKNRQHVTPGARKLELERRTLRTLDRQDLAQVAGGAPESPKTRDRGTIKG